MVLKLGTLQKLDQKYLESFEMRSCRRTEKISWTGGVKKESITSSRAGEVHPIQNKMNEA